MATLSFGGGFAEEQVFEDDLVVVVDPGRVGIAGGAHALTRDEVMTAREVAELLEMPVSTVYQLARRGKLPASRLGRTWRFLRPRLEDRLAG